MAFYPQLIIDALKTVRYPGNGKSIIENNMLEDDIRIDGKRISFSLIFKKKTDPFIKSLIKTAEQAILSYVGEDAEIKGNIAIKIKEEEKPPTEILPTVKHIIGVSSGKGGVGKSTVAANLAVSLARMGYRTGLLDADIYGPSAPKMFGIEDFVPTASKVDGRDLLTPAEKYGVKILSIGFFVDPDTALLWRGSMASNALKQLITEGDWGELNFLVIDMPPGTGDIQITMVQMLHFSGAVVVSTPQQVALADARKGVQMFGNDKVNVPVLGVVENMAWFTPAELPHNKYYIFGKDGAKRLAEELNVPLLAQIPLVQGICESGDSGNPIATTPTSQTGQAFDELAKKVVQACKAKGE